MVKKVLLTPQYSEQRRLRGCTSGCAVIWYNLRFAYILILFVGGLIFSSIITPPGDIYAQDIITPDRIELTMEPGGCTDRVVTVTLGKSPIPQLDVALVIDVTGSMKDVISEVRQSAGRIVANTRSLVPNAAFALATLADYPGSGGFLSLLAGYGGPEDYPWRVERDFTQDESSIQVALDQITLMDGGDAPESYLRALYETQFLNWREGSRRIVILFGDSTPHDPDPGKDGTENTSDDLTLEGVIQELQKSNITVLGIYTNESVRSFYETVATTTGGQSFLVSRTEHVPQVIQQLLESTVTRIRLLTLMPTPPGTRWLHWEPTAHYEVTPQEKREFAVRLCVPEETSGGDYTFDLAVMGDGATVGQIPVLVHVVERTSVSGPQGRFWWWLIIPLLLLPLVIILWQLRRKTAPGGPPSRPTPRRGGIPSSGQPIQPPRSRPGGADITHGRDRPGKRE